MNHIKLILKGWPVLLILLGSWGEWQFLNFLNEKHWLKEAGVIVGTIITLFLMYFIGAARSRK